MIAAPYIMSTLGASIPAIGGFVTDVLAFTGAATVIDEAVQYFTGGEGQTQVQQEKKIDITPDNEDIQRILPKQEENINKMLSKLKGRI